jgi:hypothetical protein
MAFNLKATKALADSTTLHLRDPKTDELLYDVDKDGNPDENKPLTIELYGKSSKQHRAWLASVMRKQAREKEAARNSKVKEKTLEQLEEDNAEYLSIVTIAVNNFDLGNGPLKTKEDFVALYSDPTLEWINEQVGTALGDSGNFLK